MHPSRLHAVISTLVIALALGACPTAGAFHDGGVAVCNSCHIMHNSEEGQPVVSGQPGDWLLRAETPSDLCLSCHGDDLGMVFGTDPLNPPPQLGAGNFVFLLEDNLNDGPGGAADPISGDAAGHNINAPSRGMAADGTMAMSPGGSYPAREMGCTSCHDPHGNGNFRMLRDAGNGLSWEPTFAYNAPTAVGLDITAGSVESNTSHTAYQAGMSLWCGNCHEAYLSDHNDNPSAFEHPTRRALSNEYATHYNHYNGTDDPNGGNIATAYLAEVPFEDMSNTTTSTRGPNNSSRIICLTCHRAHASSSPHAGRWDFNVSLLADDGVASGSYPIPDPYASANQQQLCHKCHSPIPD